MEEVGNKRRDVGGEVNVGFGAKGGGEGGEGQWKPLPLLLCSTLHVVLSPKQDTGGETAYVGLDMSTNILLKT